MVYMENLKESTQKNNSKVAGCQFNIQKSIMFHYISSKHMETDI